MAPLPANAAAPNVTYLFPAGAQRGKSVEVDSGSKTAPWPPKVWVSMPGLDFSPAKKTGKWQVTVATNAAFGPYLVRFYNDDGASAPRTFCVDGVPELLEQGVNDSWREAEPVAALPAIVNGRLEKRGDVDFYSVKLAAGQTLVAALDGYALGSSMDPALALLDERGVQLALNHDSHNLDPVVHWRAPRDGLVYVQVMAFVHPPNTSIEFTGKEDYVYRLRLTAGANARSARPAVVAPGRPNPLRLQDWNGKETGATVTPPADHPANEPFWYYRGDGGNPVGLVVSESPSLEAGKPGQVLTEPPLSERDTFVSGMIAEPGRADRYALVTRKGESWSLRLRAAELHSLLDGWLGVADESGKVLSERDDSGDFDPELTWRAPAEGKFFVVVRDLFRRGGPDFTYVLQNGAAVPDFSATVAVDSVSTTPGGAIPITLKVTRLNGHQANLVVTPKGLPSGVTAAPVPVSLKGGDVKLTLDVATNAPPASGPVEFVVTEPLAPFPRSRKADNPINSKDRRGDYLVNQAPHVWLRVAPAKKK